jgi:hypothetical protein
MMIGRSDSPVNNTYKKPFRIHVFLMQFAIIPRTLSTKQMETKNYPVVRNYMYSVLI